MMPEQLTHDMDLAGPWLQAAVFCEKVLTERDGVVSLIRLVDRLTITTAGSSAPETMPLATLQIGGMLMFKSGFAKGSYEVRLTMISPSDTRMQDQVVPLFLEGDERGASVGFTLNLAAKEDGLYWMDVRVRDRLVTRMPLRIVYQRIQGPMRQGPSG
jgi:hypothetical protein